LAIIDNGLFWRDLFPQRRSGTTEGIFWGSDRDVFAPPGEFSARVEDFNDLNNELGVVST